MYDLKPVYDPSSRNYSINTEKETDVIIVQSHTFRNKMGNRTANRSIKAV
jgi:hypothetical protein